MYRWFSSRCSSLSLSEVLVYGLMLGVALEVLTIGGRFGLGLQSTRDTQWLAPFTFGLRIHHGYLGVLLAGVAICLNTSRRGLRNALLMVAVALVASDLMHHFAVLWPTTGSPQFDWRYPPSAK